MESSLYQISLVAAFVAGMVALFAPCCISFLLPAYLGNVFRERKKVILMTLVYSLGIATVMLPIVWGARALSVFLFRFHDQSYLAAGVFLVIVAVMTFLGIKLPMPHISLNRKGKEIDIWSTYSLGVFSGITSACCAPVLLGVMSLSALSATAIGALGVGMAYVLGMVFPLYIGSWLIDKGNFLANPKWREVLGEFKLGGRRYVIFLANVVGGAIFLIMGGVIIYLSLNGGLGMPVGASQEIVKAAEWVNNLTGGNVLVDIAFVVVVVVIVWKLIRKGVIKDETR